MLFGVSIFPSDRIAPRRSAGGRFSSLAIAINLSTSQSKSGFGLNTCPSSLRAAWRSVTGRVLSPAMPTNSAISLFCSRFFSATKLSQFFGSSDCNTFPAAFLSPPKMGTEILQMNRARNILDKYFILFLPVKLVTVDL